MDTNEALNLLLSNLRQKFNHYNSIMTTTKDLLDMSDGRDPESFGVLLNMRENSMSQIDRLDAQNGEILSKLPQPLAQQIKECLWPAADTPLVLDNPLQTGIYDISRRNNALLQRLIDQDEQLKKRVIPNRG